MGEVSVRGASQAWKLLNGLTCVYKPGDYALRTLCLGLKKSLAQDLNQMERTHSLEPDPLSEERSLVTKDYSLDPLVLGPGFEYEDIQIDPINPLTRRMSGLVVLSVNNPKQKYVIQSKKFTRTFRIGMVLGQISDTGFVGGKIIEKATYNHLTARPQIIEKALASIRASHQREAFRYANVNLQSQEAYELAVQGPVRPDNLSLGLIFDLKCIEYSPPNIILEMTCINESEVFFLDLITELGLRLKTSAVCSKIRCIRYGVFTLQDTLLIKHTSLENVINNMIKLRHVTKTNNVWLPKTKHIKTELNQIS